MPQPGLWSTLQGPQGAYVDASVRKTGEVPHRNLRISSERFRAQIRQEPSHLDSLQGNDGMRLLSGVRVRRGEKLQSCGCLQATSYFGTRCRADTTQQPQEEPVRQLQQKVIEYLSRRSRQVLHMFCHVPQCPGILRASGRLCASCSAARRAQRSHQ